MALNEYQFRQVRNHHYLHLMADRARHSERVRNICEEIVWELPLKAHLSVRAPLLYCAAQVHDISKFDSNKLHHKLAKQHLSEELGSAVSKRDLQLLGEIIRVHRGRFEPRNHSIALEAAILRMADKIDQVDQGKAGAKKSYKNSRDRIKIYFKCKENKGTLPCSYKKFKNACKQVLDTHKEQRDNL